MKTSIVARGRWRGVGMASCAALALLAGAGCKARLESALTINGAAFTPTSCRSGQALGYAGVELSDAAGTRLRIAATPGGQGLVYYMPAGASMAPPLGLCGPFTVNTQNSTVNNVRNVEGNATLNCNNGVTTVQGTVTFGNCH